MLDKKYFFPDYTYVGSKTALIRAIRNKRPDWKLKDLKEKKKEALYRIFQKVDN